MSAARGFKYYYVWVHACWTVGWLAFFAGYLPWTQANEKRDAAQLEAERSYSQCTDHARQSQVVLAGTGIGFPGQEPAVPVNAASKEASAGASVGVDDNDGLLSILGPKTPAACESEHKAQQAAIAARGFFLEQLNSSSFLVHPLQFLVVLIYVFLTPDIAFAVLLFSIKGIGRQVRPPRDLRVLTALQDLDSAKR